MISTALAHTTQYHVQCHVGEGLTCDVFKNRNYYLCVTVYYRFMNVGAGARDQIFLLR